MDGRGDSGGPADACRRVPAGYPDHNRNLAVYIPPKSFVYPPAAGRLPGRFFLLDIGSEIQYLRYRIQIIHPKEKEKLAKGESCPRTLPSSKDLGL